MSRTTIALAFCFLAALVATRPTSAQIMLFEGARVIPGDGKAPIVKMLQKLKEKQYSGALSVELFLANLTGGDPQMVAAEIKQKCEKVMQQAGVL